MVSAVSHDQAWLSFSVSVLGHPDQQYIFNTPLHLLQYSTHAVTGQI